MSFKPLLIIATMLALALSANASTSCAEIADSTARSLATQFCETVKDAYASEVVVVPRFSAGVEGSIGGASGCTRTHTMICKRTFARLVEQDFECRRLFRKDFSFDLGGKRTSSQEYYTRLQREGCQLHTVGDDT
jgi:hypothetical protein